MFQRFSQFFATLWSRLFFTMEKPGEKEPLTKFSFVIILLLDIFLFVMIYDGIQEQTKVVTTPSEFASSACRGIIEQFSDLSKLQSGRGIVDNLYSDYQNSKNGYTNSEYSSFSSTNDRYSYGYIELDSSNASPVCTNIRVMKQEINADRDLVNLFLAREITQRSISDIDSNIASLRGNYNTKLNEKIAGISPDTALDPGTAETTKFNIQSLEAKKSVLETQLQVNTTTILATSAVSRLKDFVVLKGQAVLLEYNNRSFWYPAKKFAVQALFLIPLFLIVGLWSGWALHRGRIYQVLLSSHVLAVLSLFILLKMLELILEIIPHTFFARLLAWLTSMEIIGLWYYFVVAIAVGATLGLIYFIQRRVKAAALLQASQIGARRAEKGDCWSCGAHLLVGSSHCIRCGESQLVECNNCHTMTPLAGEHCRNCGSAISPLEIQPKILGKRG